MSNRTDYLAHAFNKYDDALEVLDEELKLCESYLDLDNLFANLCAMLVDKDNFDAKDRTFLEGMQTYNQKASGNKTRFQHDRQKVRMIRIWLKYYYERCCKK